MPVVVIESGAFLLLAKYIYQKQDGGVYYFRRRIPDDVRKHYPKKKTGNLVYSLKTKDVREATKKANQDALRQDAMWKSFRNGDVSHGPEVVDAALELLRSHGLRPGDGSACGGDDDGLDGFVAELERQALANGAPRGSHEAPSDGRHWSTFLPPVHKVAGDLLFGSRPPVFLSQALQEFQERKGEGETTKAGIDRAKVVNAFIAMFGDLPIEQYSRENANEFVKSLLAKGNKPSTVVRRLNSIRPVFKETAREHELEDRRIFEAVHIPKADTEPAKRAPYSNDEIRLIQDGVQSEGR